MTVDRIGPTSPQAFFKTNGFELRDAARCRDNAAAGRSAIMRDRNDAVGAGNSPTMSR
jgi:hypothetical protein